MGLPTRNHSHEFNPITVLNRRSGEFPREERHAVEFHQYRVAGVEEDQKPGDVLARFRHVGIDSVDDNLHAIELWCGKTSVKFLTKSPFSERNGVFCCAPRGGPVSLPEIHSGNRFYG